MTGAIAPNLIPQSLKTLIFCASAISDLGLSQSIARPEDGGMQFSSLRSLDLSHSQITSAVLRSLPKKLTSLNVSFSAVSMEGLASYLSVPRALTTLFVAGLKDIDVAKLKALAPKLTIIN